MKCRHCKSQLEHLFLDLGFAPPSNAYLDELDLENAENYYPLKIFICDNCWLAQTVDYAQADKLFDSDYAYFSSYSSSWLKHAKQYVVMISELLNLNEDSFVIEIAANDGYLLKNFVASSIPCLGIEPSDSTANVAEECGIHIEREFFGKTLAKQLFDQGKQADLIIGNNVYAHVPDINDFTNGLKTLLKPDGIVTLEFPHLFRILEEIQFDTIYHEHYSYLSLHTVSKIFIDAGLRIWRVEELSTHGGSLRIYGCHDTNDRQTCVSVKEVLEKEKKHKMQALETYKVFQKESDRIKDELLLFLINQKKTGKKVTAYGAAAKGNTLLNYGGIKPDLLTCVYDASPYKQNKYLPGSHIPIYPPERIKIDRPDIILILPWNIKDEIVAQLSYARSWGAQFVTAMPELNYI